MNWQRKKTLVTGSDGFIGSHLVERLVGLGASVRALVLYNSFNSWGWLDTLDKELLKSVEIFAGDIRDPHRVQEMVKDVDIIFHLAALIAIPYSYHAPDSYMETNVKDIYACGDIAEFEGTVYGNWPAAVDMGKIIGRSGNTAKAIRTLLRVVGMKNN